MKIIFQCVSAEGLSAIPTHKYKDRFIRRAVKQNFVGAKMGDRQSDTASLSDAAPDSMSSVTSPGRRASPASESKRESIRATLISAVPTSPRGSRGMQKSIQEGASE